MTKQFLWPWELAREVGVSARTICRMADAGVVPCIRDGQGRRRFRPDVLPIVKAKLGLIEETPPSTEGLA